MDKVTLESGKILRLAVLEAFYKKSPYFKEVGIILSTYSNGHQLLTAFIFPNFEYCLAKGVSQIKDRISWEMDKVSRLLPVDERVRNYNILKTELPKIKTGEIDRAALAKQSAENVVSGEYQQPVDPFHIEDTLLSSDLCRKALEYLSQKLKRPINLDDNLELDLGLDSLERIAIFFEFQRISGAQMDERQFFFITTVRDALTKLREVSANAPADNETVSWADILHASPEPLLKNSIAIKQSLLSEMVNLIVFLFLVVVGRLFFLLTVKGKANIPKKGAFILCPNHSSYLDVPLLVAALPFYALKNTYFLGYSAYLNHPLFSWAKKIFRLIPVDPASKLADTLLLCGYVLRNNKALCMFAEGIRSFDGEIKQFKRGIGILSAELKLDVLPVYIKGAYQAWPPYKILPSLRRVEIIFGQKITFTKLENQVRESIDRYQDLADNIRSNMLKLKEG